jgi:hypothetical protein
MGNSGYECLNQHAYIHKDINTSIKPLLACVIGNNKIVCLHNITMSFTVKQEYLAVYVPKENTNSNNRLIDKIRFKSPVYYTMPLGSELCKI